MGIHSLENGHGEQLLKGGQQHEIGEIIQLIHALPFHQTQQPEVFRRVFQDGLDLIVSVGDQPEGKTARPQKQHIGHPAGQFDIVEETLAALELPGAEHNKLPLGNAILLPQGGLFLRRQRIKLLLRYKIRDIGHLFPGNAVLLQLPDEIRIDRNQIIHALIEPDHIPVKYVPDMIGQLEAFIQGFGQEMHIAHRNAPAPGELPHGIELRIDSMVMHDVAEGIPILIAEELVCQFFLDQLDLFLIG